MICSICTRYLAAEAREPARSAAKDGGGNCDGLDVGHSGRAAEHAHVGGEGGLQARLPLAALVKIQKKTSTEREKYFKTS